MLYSCLGMLLYFIDGVIAMSNGELEQKHKTKLFIVLTGPEDNLPFIIDRDVTGGPLHLLNVYSCIPVLYFQ